MMLVYRLAEALQHEIHAVREVLQEKNNEVLQDEIEKAFSPVFLFSVPRLIINNSGALKETWATNHSKMVLAKVCLGAGGQKELSQGFTDRTPACRQADRQADRQKASSYQQRTASPPFPICHFHQRCAAGKWNSACSLL